MTAYFRIIGETPRPAVMLSELLRQSGVRWVQPTCSCAEPRFWFRTERVLETPTAVYSREVRYCLLCGLDKR